MKINLIEMNHFLFITHSTPIKKRTLLRNALMKIYSNALLSQTYPHWDVVILGDSIDVEDKRFHFFDLPDDKTTIHANLLKILESQEFNALLNKSQYIIKLDDDDIISPHILEQLKDFNGDLYYDTYHTFIDITSGIITQQKRPWMASTCVHKKQHAWSTLPQSLNTNAINLLYSDHSKTWHLYYKNKNIFSAPPDHPVYLRILSPTSITAGQLIQKDKFNFEEVKEKYYHYLSSFGEWKKSNVRDFDKYLVDIQTAWKNFSGLDWHAPLIKQNKTNLLGKLKRKIKSLFLESSLFIHRPHKF